MCSVKIGCVCKSVWWMHVAGTHPCVWHDSQLCFMQALIHICDVHTFVTCIHHTLFHHTLFHHTLCHHTLFHHTLFHHTLFHHTLFHHTLFHHTLFHHTLFHHTLFHHTPAWNANESQVTNMDECLRGACMTNVFDVCTLRALIHMCDMTHFCFMTPSPAVRMLIIGWRRLIGSPRLQIIFHKRATKYRSLLRKMTRKDKGTYESSPPCTDISNHTLCTISSLQNCFRSRTIFTHNLWICFCSAGHVNLDKTQIGIHGEKCSDSATERGNVLYIHVLIWGGFG